MLRTGLLVVSRVIEIALVLLGVAVVVFDSGVYLALWDLVALVYLVMRMRRLSRAKRASDPADTAWLRSTLGRRSGLLFTLFTSLVGISAGLMIVLDGAGELEAVVAKLIGTPAVVFAWAILHFGYAERYARDYYNALPERVLVFPETERPTLVEFAYFSFTLGTSFAVSDVETRGTAIRLRVLTHSVLAFLYNTAIVGIAVGVISGK
ncbi:DUF1345 domain-containing protein [Amycolatopsis sp. EV170708-02-1]|uniref:DUF1345 domain-containing protein n=1 Tax=Amycolatopsis sp. EV170708-02-1 TaxID=2919322 RepID=UPI001F0C06B3|nr:DUF1345 domain-containing protein [Amycolatopsis sp. EV170708-02-1]UMP00763.1 DUF1345 domain-containing protein [Amycolatopsis sp. EV170708-02-1]